MGDAAGADQDRGDAIVAQSPRQRQLRQRLTPGGGDVVESADVAKVRLVQHVRGERGVLRRARILGNAFEVLAREHSLGEGREGDAPDSLVTQHVEQAVLDPAVQHRVRRLVDQQGSSQSAQDGDRLGRAFVGVRRFPTYNALP